MSDHPLRIAAFSDVHGNLAALEAVLADIQQRDVDHLICLGDLAALGPYPEQVIQRIRGLGCPVALGNCDTWHQEPLPAGWQPADARQAVIYDFHVWLKDNLGPEELAYLHGLPAEPRIGPLLGVHGSPRDIREAMLQQTPETELAAMIAGVPDDVEVVVCGHTHHTMRRQIRNLLIVGAGSVGMPADGDPRPCYALLERGPEGWDVQWPRPAYDVEAALAEARATTFPHLDLIGAAWRSGLGMAA
jgi:predicted phosphodiesterase